MPNRFDFGGVSLRAGGDNSATRRTPETPFCIAIVGDFSGRASRGIANPKTIAERRPHLVDRDNFEEVLAKHQVELHLPTGGDAPVMFRFRELEDFHPDRLFENDAFRQFKRLREQLQDPERFARVAEQAGLLPPEPASPAGAENPTRVVVPNPFRLASGSLLDDMIEQTESRLAELPRRTDAVHDFARELGAKYAVSAPDARQEEVIAAVDRAIGDAMSAILHHPQFQALEALWRATFLLVRELETDSSLRIYLVDISREELAADLKASDARETGVYRLFVEQGIQTPGADPWSLVVLNVRFGALSGDLNAMSRLAKIAHAGGAVFVAEADSSLLGCKSLAETPHPRDWKGIAEAETWATLRHLSEAASLALALPRFLLRLPYGKRTSAVESIEFEEFPEPPVHEHYLWGNPAFAVALLLGQSFSEAGWEMQPGSVAQINHLPQHVYGGPGESESKPCAEVMLTDAAVERILAQGLIPLVAFKGRDSVRVGRFQSVADGGRALTGRWEVNAGSN